MLKKQGASDAQIEDINFNPFAGTIELRQLKIITDGFEPLVLAYVSSDIDMLELFSSRVVLKDISIKGLTTRIQRTVNRDISIAGLTVFSNAEPAEINDTSTHNQSSQ